MSYFKIKMRRSYRKTMTLVIVGMLVLAVSAVTLYMSGQAKPTVSHARRVAPHSHYPGDTEPTSANTLRDSNSTSANAVAVARALLRVGSFREAASRLEQAALRFPSDANLASARASVWLEQYHHSGDGEALMKATSAAAQAVRLDSQSPAAAFNYAVVLEDLHLRDDAIAAWATAASLESDSIWSTDARAHRQRLAIPTMEQRWRASLPRLEQMGRDGDVLQFDAAVRNAPMQARLFAEETLLPMWAKTGDSRFLQTARMIGATLASLGDRQLGHSVEVIDAALGTGDRRRIAKLATGHLQYAAAREALDHSDIALASHAIEVALRKLRDTDSPFAYRAGLVLGSCAFSRNDLSATLKALDDLESDAGDRLQDYPILRAQIAWLRGLVAVVRGSPAEAASHYERAHRALSITGETENIAAVHGLLAEAYEYLGDRERAFRNRDKALALIAEVGTPKRTQPILSEATDANAAAHPEVALLYQNVVVRLARKWGVNFNISDALIWRAAVNHHGGNLLAATRDIDEARKVALCINDPHRRVRTLADVDAVEGAFIRPLDPRAAAELLTKALSFFENEGNDFHIARLLLERGRCNRAMGDIGAAQADFRRGLSIDEKHRSRVPQNDLRLSLFERAGSLFDEAIAMEIERGHVTAALELAERAQARALLDILTSVDSNALPVAHPLPLAEIQAALPGATALVEYAVLPHLLVAWIVRAGSVDVVSTAVEESILAAEVTKFDLSSQSSEARVAARRLDKLLIDPIRSHLMGVSQVVFVPDGAVTSVPFAALFDGERYLIERASVIVAPSAAVFTIASASKRTRSVAPDSVVVVANPAFDGETYASFQNLPEAEREGLKVATGYPHATFLRGSAATPSAVTKALSNATLLHYAGHGLVNLRHPDYSALLLAGRGNRGAFYARDIATIKAPRLRLVVLSACSTARGKAWQVEGESSLARAFLSTGVPHVVATMSPVDDTFARQFVEHLHAELRNGLGPADALRNTQREFMKRSPSLEWAAFQIIGS